MLAPKISVSISEAMIKKIIDPIKERNNNVLTRNFENEDEAIKVYKNTCNKLIRESEKRNNPIDKYNLELIHLIYDLLPYDQVNILMVKNIFLPLLI